MTWARDSLSIYFVSDHRDEPYYELPATDLYLVSISGGEPRKLTSFDMGAGALAVSPDGKRAAFYASTTKPVRSYSQPDLWVMDLSANAQPRNLLSFRWGRWGGRGVTTQRRAAGRQPTDLDADGRRSTACLRKKVERTRRVRCWKRRQTNVTTGDHAITNFRATADIVRIRVADSTPTRIGDLFWLEKAGAAPKQLTGSMMSCSQTEI